MTDRNSRNLSSTYLLSRAFNSTTAAPSFFSIKTKKALPGLINITLGTSSLPPKVPFRHSDSLTDSSIHTPRFANPTLRISLSLASRWLEQVLVPIVPERDVYKASHGTPHMSQRSQQSTHQLVGWEYNRQRSAYIADLDFERTVGAQSVLAMPNFAERLSQYVQFKPRGRWVVANFEITRKDRSDQPMINLPNLERLSDWPVWHSKYYSLMQRVYPAVAK